MVARSQPRTAPQSPSSRRAWIEIQKVLKNTAMLSVALLAEGVDRNDQMQPLARWVMTSPSSRRAWIEMIWTCKLTLAKKSPSSRRAWIEMSDRSSFCSLASVALLAEGVDRNKITISDMFIGSNVALLAEGVDRNLMAKGILLFL